MASSLHMLAQVAFEASDSSKRRKAHNRVVSKCDQCNEEFPTAQLLERHARTEEHKSWFCDYPGCGKRFKDRSAFSRDKSRHRALEENPEAGHACQGCGHIFPQKYNLAEHLALNRCRGTKINTFSNASVCELDDPDTRRSAMSASIASRDFMTTSWVWNGNGWSLRKDKTQDVEEVESADWRAQPIPRVPKRVADLEADNSDLAQKSLSWNPRNLQPESYWPSYM